MSNMGGKTDGEPSRIMTLTIWTLEVHYKPREKFFQEVSFKIGNHNSVKFWKDRWLNNQSLNVTHPVIYRIASDTDSSVAQNTEDGVRVPCFRRNFQDWELNELLDFFRTLEGASMSPHLPDSLKWGSSETVAAALWNMFISIAGINWILPQSVKEAVGSWSLREVDSHIKKTWQMILSCFFGAFGRKGISDVLMVSQLQLAV
ncbi:hypothetical protein H5410_039645 [Solanum commersonii]|uniref:Uncharacterized protein n=1 Tax=Solanum commersonii TaxID=4109 RepID=A0A9J5XLI7_SOLCO|nr:hypothetical protein H5410_039645 [Solanum commersonii]